MSFLMIALLWSPMIGFSGEMSKGALITEPVKKVMQNCVHTERWKKVKCQFPKKAPEDYQREWYDEALNATALKIAKNAAEALNAFNRGQQAWRSCPLNPRAAVDKDGEAIRDLLISSLAGVKKKYHLNECETACLALCASSNLVMYNFNNTTKSRITEAYRSTAQIFKNPKGECTEFSRVAETLAQGLGLDCHSVESISARHSFVAFHFNKKWVYAEPQEDQCTFYPAE